jgi:biotin carboxyl carrier protein
MTYITTINEQTYTIDPGENSQQNSITLNGIEHTIDWRHIAPLADSVTGAISAGGHYSLLIGGQSYDIFVRRITKANEKTGQTYEIQIADQRFEVKVEDERTSKLIGLVRAGAHAGEAILQAPMPGLVVGIPVEQGATVTEGQTVIVLEAMKMENDLPSPIAGIIKEVRVSKGQAVDQGQVLVVIESNA